MKKVAVIVSIVIVVLILGAATYLIITMNNTILALSDKISAQEAQNQTADIPNPEPTENHDIEIIELKNLYSQKELLVQSYYDKANDIKESYSGNKDFTSFYAIASNDYDVALSVYNDIHKKSSEYSEAQITGALCALYSTYADKQKKKLIEASGNIDILNIEYSGSLRDSTKKLLDSVVSLPMEWK